MGHKFIHTPDPDNEYDRATINYEIKDEAILLPDLLEEFERYLRATGYVVNGYLKVVKDEDKQRQS